MKRRALLGMAALFIPSFGFCEDGRDLWRVVEETEQLRKQMFEAQFQENKHWTKVNPILPTNYVEWMAQLLRVSYHYNKTGKDGYENVNEIFVEKFVTDFFNGTVLYNLTMLKQLFNIGENEYRKPLITAAHAILCPKSQYGKLENWFITKTCEIDK